MMTKKERQELYNTNRPYYGYSMKEWASFKLKPVDDHDHTKCSTCHRMKISNNFISEYSQKQLKICNFCQNRNYHKYRIDGRVSCSRHNGICNTAFIVGICNDCVSDFRTLDLSEYVNTNPIAVSRKQQLKDDEKQIKQQKITCQCGVEVTRGKFNQHLKSKRCQKYFEELNKNDNDTTTESTKCSDNGSVSSNN